MYSECVFCSGTFASNAALERLPVGRRIAFDAAKGRLWVVCRMCERWNLVPQDVRWEAIEEAERLFRDTRLRVATEHMGLARTREGTELVRIGRPLRPEFAAWRYGDQFGRRRRRLLLVAGGAAAVGGTALTAGMLTGLVSLAVLSHAGSFISLWTGFRTVVRVPMRDGEVLELTRHLLNGASIGRHCDGCWFLRVDRTGGPGRPVEFTGRDAERAAALLLPQLNASGAGRRHVEEAVGEIERCGGADAYMSELFEKPPLFAWQARTHAPERSLTLAQLPRTHRLALEMALHEERERQVLTGELKALEFAWRDAEQVAAIADDLLLPPAIRARLGA